LVTVMPRRSAEVTLCVLRFERHENRFAPSLL
jgi:hypothetical protein